jgi:hypothetical protein
MTVMNHSNCSSVTGVRMSDENWTTWVASFIQRADAVVMDITRLTDSLGWELNACKETLTPPRLILACGWYEDDNQNPWPALSGIEVPKGCDQWAGLQGTSLRGSIPQASQS